MFHTLRRLARWNGRQTLSSGPSGNGKRLCSRPRLFFEQLETRTVPTVVFLVTSYADSGPGTLRQAILDVDGGIPAQPNEIRIVTPPGNAPVVIQLQSALPYLSANCVITGRVDASGNPVAGQNPIVKGLGNVNGPTFGLLSMGPNGFTVTINHVDWSSGASSGNGGAINSTAQLTINSCVFENNSAAGSGGAIYQASAPLTVNGVNKVYTFYQNVAGGDGGGIYFTSGGAQPLNINVVDFWEDIAGGNGGGMYYNATGDMTISGSYIAECNALYGSGGGFYIANVDTVTIENSNINGNSTAGAGGSGGGFYVGQSLNLYVYNTSIESNTTSIDNGGFGGGFYAYVFTNVVLDEATTIAFNSAFAHPTTDGFLLLITTTTNVTNLAAIADNFVIATV